MIIALDYDKTYTVDSEFWDNFIYTAKERGHEVICVTMRHETEAINVPCQIIYTARKAKARMCAEMTLKVDVWIDDTPWFIHNDYF